MEIGCPENCIGRLFGFEFTVSCSKRSAVVGRRLGTRCFYFCFRLMLMQDLNLLRSMTNIFFVFFLFFKCYRAMPWLENERLSFFIFELLYSIFCSINVI